LVAAEDLQEEAGVHEEAIFALKSK